LTPTLGLAAIGALFGPGAGPLGAVIGGLIGAFIGAIFGGGTADFYLGVVHYHPIEGAVLPFWGANPPSRHSRVDRDRWTEPPPTRRNWLQLASGPFSTRVTSVRCGRDLTGSVTSDRDFTEPSSRAEVTPSRPGS